MPGSARKSSRLLLLRHPRRAQHGAGAREAGHHGADGNTDRSGDFAIRKIVDFTQHERLPETDLQAQPPAAGR